MTSFDRIWTACAVAIAPTPQFSMDPSRKKAPTLHPPRDLNTPGNKQQWPATTQHKAIKLTHCSCSCRRSDSSLQLMMAASCLCQCPPLQGVTLRVAEAPITKCAAAPPPVASARRFGPAQHLKPAEQLQQ